MSVRRVGERDENGNVASYYVSQGSNQRAMRPGQPVGRQAHQLHIDPTREWVRRNAPVTKFDADSDNFFSGTNIIRSVGKDEGLSGVRCMTVVNNRVWIGEREGCYSVWDFHSGERIFRSTKKKDIFVWSVLGPVTGSLVWVGSSDAFIRVFHGETMELVKEMKEHVGGVYTLADTPGGRLVFSGSSDFTIVKWDGLKMERLTTFNGHKNNVRSLIVVGKRLFSGSDDHSIRMWDIQTNQPLGSLEDHSGGVHALCFSKHLWSASEDKTIRVWNPDNVDQPVVKVLKQPHNGQINCLSLTGSLIWSSSWNVTYVWDPETFECKAQYKNHEGCINAMLPVHQAVVSRVWSASNDGVINLWDTECTYRRALSASSDGRLEEALLQLDEAKGNVDASKKKIHEMEQICIQLQGDKDRSQMLMDSQKDKYEQQAKEHRRQHQESAQRNIDLKERLDHLGAVQTNNGPEFDSTELLEAYQLGLTPGSTMPVDYEDDDFLDAGERARREKLRDAFNKGKANAQNPQEPDDLEERLRRALGRAHQAGDPVAAAFIREWLDDKFPKWRQTAAQPIMPIGYLEEGSLTPSEGKRRAQLRQHFIDGVVDGSQDKAPVQPTDVSPSSDDMDAWRDARDAFLAGKDASRVLPEHLNSPATKNAFCRGLGETRGAVPEEYLNQKDVSENENLAKLALRTAFLKGRYAANAIPRNLDDDTTESFEDRDAKRRLREHFLNGLNQREADLPMEYKDQPSDLSPVAQKLREDSRFAFKSGQCVSPLIPAEFSEGEVDDIQPAVKSLRTELREVYLDGYAQEKMPATPINPDVYNKQLRDAYKKGWLAGCPFDIDTLGAVVSPTRESRGASQAQSDREASNHELLDRIRDLEDANRDIAIERDQAEDTLAKALADLERLGRQIAGLDEKNTRLENKLAETELDRDGAKAALNDLGGQDVPRTDAIRGEREPSTPPPARSPSEKAALTPKQHHHTTPRANEDVEGSLQTMRPFHPNRVCIGGTLIRALPPINELSDEEAARLKDMEDVYAYTPGKDDDEGDLNLPRLYDMTPEDADFIRHLMSGPATPPPKSPSAAVAVTELLQEEGTNLPQEVREELERFQVGEDNYEQRQHTPENVRNTVEELDEALPEDVREELLEAVKQADDPTVLALTEIFEGAIANDDVPRDVRKELDELLITKDVQTPAAYAGALRTQAHRMVANKKIPDDVRSDLRKVLGEDEEGLEKLQEKVATVVNDSALPMQTRLALNDAVSPARTNDVPDAVRQVLRDGGLKPDTEYSLRDVMDGHDAREDELRRTVKDKSSVPKTEDGSALASAVRKAARSQDNTPEEHRELLRAYNAYEGRTAAVEDAARGCLHDTKVPEKSRERLRNGILASGVDRDELVADAVRFAVSNDDVPASVNSSLRTGLAEHESRQGDLCSAVRKVLADGTVNKDLSEALQSCEDRSMQAAAALVAESNDKSVTTDLAKALKSLVASTCRRHSNLRETAYLIGGRDDVPRAVGQELQELCDAHNAEEAAAVEVAAEVFDNSKLRTQDPAAVISTMRETLLESNMAVEERNAVNNAVEASDDSFAVLRDAVRRNVLNSSVPSEARKQLRAAACESDSAADVLNANTRTVLIEYEVSPATRYALHTAAYLSNNKYETLYDAARAGAKSGDLTESQRKELKDATAETSGKPQEMYRVARAAAHDKDVPQEVRRVLLEALGEQSSADVADNATNALFEQEVSAEGKEALKEALTKDDAAAVVLQEAVKEILSGGYDLSDSMAVNLADALGPVEKSNQQLLEVVEDKGLDTQTREEMSGATTDNVSELVRSALQQAGINDKGDVGHSDKEAIDKLTDALSQNQQDRTNLEEVVREAISRGILPQEANEKLAEALREKEVETNNVRNVTKREAKDPLVEKAESMLAKEELPESRRREIQEALDEFKGRDQVLENELCDLTEHIADPLIRKRMTECEGVQDLDDLLSSNDCDEDTEMHLHDALHRYKGKREILDEALSQGTPAHAPSHMPAVQEALEKLPLDAKTRTILNNAVGADEDAAEGHHDHHQLHTDNQYEAGANEQYGDHGEHEVREGTPQSRSQLYSHEDFKQLGFGKKDGSPESARSSHNAAAPMNDADAERLDELQRIVDLLGGYNEARRLAEQADHLNKLDHERLRKEQELEDLRRLIEKQQYTTTDSERLVSAETVLSPKEQALRNAYQEGRNANVRSPLPVNYRQQLSDDDDEKDFRNELTDAWLKGRQEAVGSVVPPEYASVDGMAEDESDVRSSLREAFLDGLGRGEDVQSNNALIQEATDKGRSQRTSELRRAGASDADPHSEVVKGFTHGVRGSSPADMDAVLSRQGIPDSDVKNAGRMYGRGKWLRNDVMGEGDEASDDYDENLTLLSTDKSRLAQLVAELEEWHNACDPNMVRSLGVAVASPHYVKVLQREIRLQKQDLEALKLQSLEEQDALRKKEKTLNDDHERAMGQLAKEREMEVDRLKDVLAQMETDITARGHATSSLHNKIERLAEKLGESSAENEALTQELIKKATLGDVTELVTYYKERERKWNELSHLNRELQAENKTLMTESTALAHKLRALSFVFESRPTLVRSLYELHKLLSHIPQTLGGFSKHAKARQLPRLEILDEIRGVGSEVDTCKDGTRWIIANLFTAYELQYLGTSPQFFIPDGRRPTWRDIQVPTKQRELLLSTWAEETGGAPAGRTSPNKRDNSPSNGAQRLQRACRERPHAVGRKRV